MVSPMKVVSAFSFVAFSFAAVALLAIPGIGS
jgi:hypothetical protein